LKKKKKGIKRRQQSRESRGLANPGPLYYDLKNSLFFPNPHPYKLDTER
jgi:hypothetical protein